MKSYVKGADEVIRKLLALKKTEMKKAIRKGSRAGAKIIAAKVKEEVPVQTGALRRAVKVRALKRSRRFTGTQVVTRVAGTGVYYGGFVELGTKRSRARGYIKSAEKAARGAASSAFVDGIKEGIEEALRRP